MGSSKLVLGFLGCVVWLAVNAASSSVRGDVWVGGHGDIGVLLNEQNQLELHFHFEDDVPTAGGTTLVAGEYGPSQVQIFVPDGPFTQPAGSQWNFLGAGAGNPLWLLPDNAGDAAQLGAPFLGFASEDLNPADWAAPMTWSLSGKSGPGEFSLFRFGALNPTVFMATSDGVGSNDFFQSPIGEHDHFLLAFSAPGIYQVDFTVSSIHNQFGTLSDTATFTYFVGVPEPSSMALLGCAGLGWTLRAWRVGRRKPQA